MKHFLYGTALAVAALTITLFTGCSSSNNNSQLPTSLDTKGATGKVSVTFTWPTETADALSRVIPVKTASLSVTLTQTAGYNGQPNGNYTTTGTATKAGGGGTGEIDFDTVPTGTYTVKAVAYDGAGGAGMDLADSTDTGVVVTPMYTSTGTIMPGGTIATPTLTLISTITTLKTTPATISITHGASTNISVLPYNANNQIVTDQRNNYTVTADDTSMITSITYSAPSYILHAGSKTGTTAITITEKDSNISIHPTVTIN
jgi:hypothetical protein